MSGLDASEIDTAILRAGADDYLDLSYLTYLLEEKLATREPAIVRRVLLEALQRLLMTQQLRAGELEPPGEFVPWSVKPKEAYDRIESAFGALDRPVQVGDIAWFEVPE